jgi:small-conductance mechanosensitive channel
MWLQRMNTLVQTHLGISIDTVEKILWSIFLILVFLFIRRATAKFLERRVSDLARRYILLKSIGYLFGFLVFLVLLRIWFGGAKNLAAYFGILSAGLAIALRDPLTNLAGWLFINIRKPFVVGDRVQIGNHAGDVIDIQLFQFTLVEVGNWVEADQSTGRIIHLPNGLVFHQSVANYTQGFNFIWNELPVTVTFESDWKKAQSLLQEIAEKHTAIQSEEAARQVRQAARQFLIFFQHLSPIVWTSVAENGVTLTIRYLCDPRKRRSSAHKIWESILEVFAGEPDIDFAYPTTRFYENPVEGKPGARAEPTSR